MDNAKVQLIILGIVIAFSLFLAGGLFSNYQPNPNQTFTNFGICCDTGDGEACHPQTGPDQKITHNGAQYGLLRTKVILAEGNLHLEDSGEKTQDGKSIIINSSDSDNNVNAQTTQG